MELENILPFLSIFNAITIFLLNASPLVGLFKIIKKKEKYTYLPFCMLLFFSLNSLCWTCYWFKISNMIFMLSFYISIIIDSGLVIIYLYFLCNFIKRFLLSSILLVVIELIITISVLLFLFDYLKFYRRCMIVINTIMYISPGQNLIKVFKEKKCKFIPILSTMMGLICSGGWLLFGKIIDDIYIIIPNGLGLIFSTLYSLIWLIYYIKEKIDKKKSTFYSEDINKTRDVQIG